MTRILYECWDLEKPFGGVRRLYRHVEILSRNGYDAAILHHRPGFRVEWLTSTAPVKYASSGLDLEPDDVLVIPEGHTDVIASTVFSPCRRVVIALNWANIFSALPVGLDWRHLGISEVIAGSQYEQTFVKQTMGLDSTVIVSGIDGTLFQPAARKVCQVAFMPRKNANVFHLIASVFRSKFPQYSEVQFVPIEGLAHEQVSRVLSESAIFLATSFPEGLARPPLEAMACGCVVVGFSGRGSLEYMDHLRNCYLADDMDVLSVAEHLGAALSAVEDGRAGGMQVAARETARRYSLEREEDTVLGYWRRCLATPPAPPARRYAPGERTYPGNDVGAASPLGRDEPAGESDPDTRWQFGFDDVYDRAVAGAPSPAVFVEVGTQPGAGTAHLAARIRESCKDIHVFAVDSFTAAGAYPGSMGGVPKGVGDVFREFCENIRGCGLESYITPILGESRASSSRFPDHSVDFVFINASRGYADVKADILTWLPKVKSEGVIAGHGYNERHPGVMKAVAELFSPGSFEVMRHSWYVADPCGRLGMGVARGKRASAGP